MLRTVSALYEVVIFTASEVCYGRTVIAHLLKGETHLVDHCLFRDKTTTIQD